MNAITTTDDKPTHDEVIRVLENSLYPGAKRESIELVLAYCRTNGLDPMLRPVYIVPTSVKKPDGTWETRDRADAWDCRLPHQGGTQRRVWRQVRARVRT